MGWMSRPFWPPRDRFRDPADLGEISDREFWTRILDHFGVHATDEDTEIDRYLVLVDGTLDIAKSLSGRLRTAILSNDSKEMSALRRKKFGFDQVFSPIIISADVGVKKPDPRIYHILLERLRVSPEECVFVDNNPANVDAARAVGIRAVLFLNAAQLRKDLRELDIDLNP